MRVGPNTGERDIVRVGPNTGERAHASRGVCEACPVGSAGRGGLCAACGEGLGFYKKHSMSSSENSSGARKSDSVLVLLSTSIALITLHNSVTLRSYPKVQDSKV